MSHEHHKGLSCSCCNPLFEHLLPKSTGKSTENAPVETSDTSSAPPLIYCQPHETYDRTKLQTQRIHTLAGGKDVRVEAIAVHNGKIIATGDFISVTAKASLIGHPEVLYLEGNQAIFPGFIEVHAHIIAGAAMSLCVDVGPFKGQDLRRNVPEEVDGKLTKVEYSQKWVIKALKQSVDAMITIPIPAVGACKEDYPWIMGRNADPSLFTGSDSKEFNAIILDAATEGKKDTYPIFLMNSSMHLAYINTAAIERLKPELGDDFAGSTTGILYEMVEIEPVFKFMAEEILNSQTDLDPTKKLNDLIIGLLKHASSLGLTYILDAAVQAPPKKFDSTDTLDDTTLRPDEKPGFDQVNCLKHIAESPDCPIRIGGALVAQTLLQFTNDIKDEYTPSEGNENFNLPFVKILTDGSNQGLTGYQYTPYACNENYERFQDMLPELLNTQVDTGIFNYGYPLEFNQLIKDVVEAGWPTMTHANGDHAVDRTLRAFQENAHLIRGQDRRDRIEHAAMLSDQNLIEMKDLGIYPSFLMGHVGYWGWQFKNIIFGEKRCERLTRCNSALNQFKLKITTHSDFGVTPLGPLRLMEQAISRCMEGSPDKSEVLYPNEKITRFEALRAATYDAAWQCHADQWVGSLEVGKCADFVVLEQSPLTYDSGCDLNPVQGMRDIPVLQTWKGGELVYGELKK
ncbi:MAG: putative amidohydrolase YtcJ [Crocinitomicaceae bacterium]|jgi:predicted amidohydrolase YtcJ